VDHRSQSAAVLRVNTSIDILLERCGASELFYFGDLDARGVAIGAGAAQRRAARKAGIS
jgi:hypothetical protein